MNGRFSISKEKLQPRILSNLLYFFTADGVVAEDIIFINYDTSMVSGMYKSKDACYLTRSVLAIHFFYGTVIISWQHLKRSIMSRYCVYFATLTATIQNSKKSMIDLRKFERYCVYLRKAIVALFFKFRPTALSKKDYCISVFLWIL